MDPHFRTCCRSSRASLHWSAMRASLVREGHAIHPRLFPHGQVFPTPSLLWRSPMMSHLVPLHRSCHHILPALPVLYLPLLLLQVGGYLPRYPSLVCCLRLIPRRTSGAEDHADCLPEISPQAHPIKQADQVIKCTLEPSGVRQCNHAISHVEEGSLVPTLLSMIAPILRALYHHRHRVYHHCIHHHIKYVGGERISLCHSTRSLKLRLVVSACPCYHCQLPPIRLEDPTGLGAHTVPFHDLQAPGTDQGVMSRIYWTACRIGA